MTSRRAVIAGGAGAAVLAALGYRAWDRGVFSSGEGPAFEAWQEWQGHAGEGAARPLHAAILAANAHNSQPWLFEPHEDSITVYADLSRNLGAADPFRRELYVSLGCAITNLSLAAEHLDCRLLAVLAGNDRMLPPHVSGGPVATVLLSVFVDEAGIDGCGELYRAIPFRHTNRGPYLPDKALPDFRPPAVIGEPMWVTVADPAAKKALGEIIVEATERFIADPEMSTDSARWFRTGRREIAKTRDGISSDGAGLSAAMSAVAKLLPDQSAAAADKYWLASTRDVQVPTAAAYGVAFVQNRLSSFTAVTVGEWWQRTHLRATAYGLAAQPLNQPIEMMDRDAVLGRKSHYVREIRRIARLDGDFPFPDPAFIFRIGYAERPAMPSPRRRFDDVVKRTGYA